MTNTRLVSEVISDEDLAEAQDLINAQKTKIQELVKKIATEKIDSKTLIDAILDIDVSGAAVGLLSAEVQG